jgi:hypothetical protein
MVRFDGRMDAEPGVAGRRLGTLDDAPVALTRALPVSGTFTDR